MVQSDSGCWYPMQGGSHQRIEREERGGPHRDVSAAEDIGCPGEDDRDRADKIDETDESRLSRRRFSVGVDRGIGEYPRFLRS